MYTVSFEYHNTNIWDTDVGQPAQVSSLRQARQLAKEHLNHPSSDCQTRVRIFKNGELVEQIDWY